MQTFFFLKKHQPDLKSTFKEGQPPLLGSKNSVTIKDPALEMKSLPAHLSLFTASARQEIAIGPMVIHCQ